MPKPDGANFYPPDMTKEEFENWVKNHPADKAAFESNFTVIKRTKDKGLEAVPYSKEYNELLVKAARLLDEAAALVDNESLANFLRLRAKAFLSDDYFESDMAWMDVKDNVIDVTIGPYEVYEDNLFNYKAAFEAFLCVRDPEETKKLDGLKAYVVEDGGESSHPRAVQEHDARDGVAALRRGRDLLRRRHEGGRADDRLQPAERRARARGEGARRR